MHKKTDVFTLDLLYSAFEVNPDPVLIMSLSGELIYSNPATQKYVESIFLESSTENITSLLPNNIKELLINTKNKVDNNISIDYELYDTFLKCKIARSHEHEVYFLYITNTTKYKNLAYYDLLTQLPNSVYLNKIIQDEISRSKKSGSCFSLFFINIHNYKKLSYMLGFEFGEKVLFSVAKKLKNIFTKSEVVAKYSDHVYAVLLPQVSLKNARVCADAIIEEFENPLIISDLRIEIEACIGIAEYPRHGSDAHSILQCAYIAMHKAQKMNSAIEPYDKYFFEGTTRKLTLATELHRALTTEELSVVYQPKIDIINNTVIGVEALMRWSHPLEGFISPEIFIEVAEQSRLIKELTLWVINKTLKDYAQLASVSKNIQLAVNITAKDLMSDSFPEIVAGLLAAWKIPDNILTLEITENALITDTEQVLSVMSRLNNIGVKLAIDDFGTGYSSLNYLRQLNVNELKIDKSFVMDMLEDNNNNIIVRAVISLAHDLNLQVTAEGVESNAILQELKNHHCDVAQGYFLSKPIRLNEIVEWIQNFS